MSIPMDVILIWLALALLWLAQKAQAPAAPPQPPPPVPPAGKPDPLELRDYRPQVRDYRTFQLIAQARGDWRMSDYYRDEANRLDAQQDTDRLAYNQALRDRILKG